jgi:uncharacterized protein (TIGR02453 family)
MIQENTLRFLKLLKKNNNREWFEKNRGMYESAKLNYLDFVGSIITQSKLFDAYLADLNPKQCVFRINRDVRFSKNKEPYKINFGASFSKGGKKIHCAGYYFHLEPGNSFIGGGLWMPPAPELKKVRQEIDYNYNEFKSIISKPIFKSTYGSLDSSEKLVRPPKEYDLENPAIELLKLKSFIVTKQLSDKQVLDPKIIKQVVQDFKTIHPLVQFLNRALDI